MLSRVWLLATPWTVVHQAPLSMGFSRQEYWNGLPWPSPGDLTQPGIKPTSLTRAGGFCYQWVIWEDPNLRSQVGKSWEYWCLKERWSWRKMEWREWRLKGVRGRGRNLRGIGSHLLGALFSIWNSVHTSEPPTGERLISTPFPDCQYRPPAQSLSGFQLFQSKIFDFSPKTFHPKT